jgi:hypothetical protein
MDYLEFQGWMTSVETVEQCRFRIVRAFTFSVNSRCLAFEA